MDFPTGVKQWRIRRFENAHQNFVQRLDDDQSFDLHLEAEEWEALTALEQYRLCTKNLQWIIRQALDRDTNIRATGSGWSLSKVAMSDDALVNTKRYRHKFTVAEAHFLPACLAAGKRPEDYRFVQCGNTISGLSQHLEQESMPAKALLVSGGSNGQTVVGAFSTNTHGSAHNVGSLPEMIRGIHVVSDPDHHYYVERSSDQVTTEAFAALIEATPIYDDDLFNALLVSFGSFGFIHGVLMEVEDRYLLEQCLSQVPYDRALVDAIRENNFSGLTGSLKYPLSDTSAPLYHFDVAINLHEFAPNDPEKGAFVRAIHKVAYRDDYPRIDTATDGYTYGDHTLGLMQLVLDRVERLFGFLNRHLIPKAVNSLFELAYDRPEYGIGTIGETFANTLFRGRLYSAAFGIDRKEADRVIQICAFVNQRTKLAGALALRFVKGTQATLGFTKWEQTCVLEIDGVDARITHRFTKKLAQRLDDANIEFTLHWGKINRLLDGERVRKMYGQEKIDAWRAQRSRIMNEGVQALFNNEFLERCDLDDYLTPPPSAPPT